MKSGWLEIELRSELTTATGDTLNGLVDVDIAHVHGVPVIPAKRLKGALLEVGKELVDWGLLKARDLYAVFGKAGLDVSSPLQIHDAHLYQIPDGSSTQVVEHVPELLRQLRESEWQEQEVLEAFTDLHTRTAIDEQDGSAKEGNLRTVRAVNKGIVLRSYIELDEEVNFEVLENTLQMCVKGLRHLGLASTRGSGEVRCKLTSLTSPEKAFIQSGTAAIKELGNGRVELPFHLELEQPLVIAGRKGLADRSEEWIPGSTLLGVFAELYIREYQCGQQAHEDERFSRIFLRGGVSFGYALPLVGGRVFAPSAAMWQQQKNANDGFDLMRGSEPSDTVLRNLDGMVHMALPTSHTEQAKPTLYKYKVRKQVRMHHARASNRAIGRALGEKQSADAQKQGIPLQQDSANRGQLFQYEAIEAGQQFYGVLQGRREDVQLLVDLAAKYRNRLRMGRSRTAEYGNVHFVPRHDFCPVLLSGEPAREPSAFVALSLVTPMLLLDESGRPDPAPRWLQKQITDKLGCDVEVKAAQLRYTTLSGYNAKWRMPKPQNAALDAGTTLIVKLAPPIAAEKLEAMFWGWDTGEGNGQVRAIPLAEEQLQQAQSFSLSAVNLEESQPVEKASAHPLLIWLAKRRQDKLWVLEQQAAGVECAERTVSIFADDFKSLGLTKIQQMRLWAEAIASTDNDSQSSYETLRKQVEEIKQSQTNQACLKLIQPCENKSSVFIQSYLRALELKARGRK